MANNFSAWISRSMIFFCIVVDRLGAELKREEIEHLVIKLIVDSVLVRSLSVFLVLCLSDISFRQYLSFVLCLCRKKNSSTHHTRQTLM